MITIKNISPLGDLIIPALNNLIVKAGETVEVSDEAGESLLDQSSNWTLLSGSKSVSKDPTPTTAPDSPAA
jgi:hypothetical protein